MTVNYTTLLALAQPVTGTESGTWGDDVNNGLTSYLDAAVSGTQTLSTDANVTLTLTQGTSSATNLSSTSAQYLILNCTGARTVARTITVPASSRKYIVINATTGGFAVNLVGAGPTTGISIAAGESALVAWNGSDFIKISNTGGAASFTNVTISGTTTLSSLTASQAVFTDASKNLVSNAITGTGNVVMSASPTLTGTITASAITASGTLTASAAVTFSGTTTTLSLGTSQTTGTWTAGGTAQTGAMTLGRSTGAQTVNIATGATTSGTTKTVNIGTAGVSGSTTAINIGSAVSGATNTITINGNPTFSGGTANGVLYLDGSKVATSGSALAFDGTNLLIGAATSTANSTLNANQGVTAKTAAASGVTPYLQLYNGNAGTDLKTLRIGGTSTGAMTFETVNDAYSSSSEKMRLDSSGNLGIGTSSPSVRLDVQGGSINTTSWVTITPTTATSNALYRSINTGGTFYSGIDNSAGGVTGTGYAGILWHTGAYPLVFATSGAEKMRLDSSGNLGLGVTPSGWDTNFKAFQLGGSGRNVAITGQGDTDAMQLWSNAYRDTGGTERYIASRAAGKHVMSGNTFAWYTAPSGTAGNAISFTQAMTLDASGNLALGQTSAAARLDVAGNIHFTGNVFGENSSGYWVSGNSTYGAGILGDGTTGNVLRFQAGSTESARIDSSGNLLVGTTTQNGKFTVDQGSSGTAGYFTTSGSTGTVILSDTGGNGAGIKFVGNGATTPNKYIRTNAGVLEFVNSAYSAVFANFTDAGAAYNTTGTWGTISDLRIKENVSTARNYLADLCRLRVVKYSLKSEKATSATKLGFIAQEVEEVFPNLVETSKNEFEGLDDMKQIKMSVLTPMLLKAVQELKAELDAVKAELATLKGA